MLETSTSLEEVTAALHAAKASGSATKAVQETRDDSMAEDAPRHGATSELEAKRARLEAEVAAARRERGATRAEGQSVPSPLPSLPYPVVVWTSHRAAELQSTLADLESRRTAAETASDRAKDASVATQRELGEAQEALGRLVDAVGAYVCGERGRLALSAPAPGPSTDAARRPAGAGSRTWRPASRKKFGFCASLCG